MTSPFPYQEILVGTDGSVTAASAVRAAASVATLGNTRLTVVTAWYREREDPPVPSEEAKYPGGRASAHEAQWASGTASDAAAIARELGVADVRAHTPVGNAADALITLAEDRPGSLVVVGTVGLGERTERMLGNIPHQLTHHSSSDVLLAGYQETPRPRTWESVALATDGSVTAALACERGYTLARAMGVEPVLLTVAKHQERGEQTLQRVAGQFPDGAQLPQKIVVAADVSRALVEVGSAYELLVIGNKGMSGPSRLLGSVSNRITHDVPTDLLLVNTSH